MIVNFWSVKALNIKRGDIYYADLSPVIGSEQGGVRPVLIVQNNVGNRFSPTVIAAAITSQQSKAKLPTHIPLYSGTSGLTKDSVVLLEQVRTIDKRRLKEKMGSVDENDMILQVDVDLAVFMQGLEDELLSNLLETYDQSPQLRRYFTNSFAPSETFAHTVAFNSRFADSCILTKGPVEKLEQLTPLTYIEYGQKIKILTENDYDSIMASGKMICRKTVTGESDQLMDMIDKQRQHG